MSNATAPLTGETENARARGLPIEEMPATREETLLRVTMDIPVRALGWSPTQIAEMIQQGICDVSTEIFEGTNCEAEILPGGGVVAASWHDEGRELLADAAGKLRELAEQDAIDGKAFREGAARILQNLPPELLAECGIA